ncbi:MAG: hypothetical protein WAM84_01070 [Candidatus Cybelea sp.]
MKTFSRSQGLVFLAGAALVAGCGGGSQLDANPVQQNLTLRVAQSGRSWMAPDAKKSDLAYISNFYSSTILAFTYPGGKYVGSISGDDPQGECTSKTSSGNWWVVESGNDEILEYAHGGTTPLETLSVTGGEPAGCTLDPTTGNLAVTILGTGYVVLFTGGSGSGTSVSDSLYSTYFAAYDDKGDLFVDGVTSSDTYGLVELPKGSSTFVSITLSPSLGFPGELQWHDNYLAVGASGGIYHFAIHGTKGKEIGVTPLCGGGGFWIQGRYVTETDPGNEDAVICKYPAGSPYKTLHGNFDLPIGATVSVAK